MIKGTSVIKIYHIILNVLPVAIMVALIPLVPNDVVLTLAYVIVIIFAFMIKYEKKEFRVLFLGFVIMIVCEYFFIATGVETFQRNSLFGMMPLWLPFLWAYGFVAIKRSVEILGR